MNLQGKYVLVAGCGVSGIAAAKLLYKTGAKVVLFDTNESLSKEDVLAKLDKGVEVDLVLGKVEKELLDKITLVVLSPGIPSDADFVNEFRA